MDRTVIDTWKAEEKEFGEKLHRKLTALTTMIHPPTEDFKKCFVEDMFLKPNQKAFFHVMHYLFTLLDPLEFKKRFYWPIVDKKSESNFRTSTVQYLMHLNEKHNLGWNNIKSYLVVMPGGMKFILFLLDFIDFITKELIKQREKCIPSDMTPSQLAEFNIKRMNKQNKLHKEYASRYIKVVDTQIVSLKENLEVLRKHMDSITIPGLQIAELLDDSTLSEFSASNRKLFENNLKLKVTKLRTIDEPLRDLKEIVDRFQNHETSMKCDKEMVKRSLLTLKNAYPDLEIGMPPNDTDSTLRMGPLLAVFNHIYPDVEKNMVVVEQSNNRNDFIGNELNALKTDIIQIETHLTKFLTSINVDAAKPPCTKITPVRSSAHVLNENFLFSKFINTPPVKLDLIDNKLNNNPRLPFLDDFLTERSIESFCIINQNNTLFPPMSAPRSTRKVHDLNSSTKQSSVKKSKIIDPARLLRTLNKDTSKASNMSRNLSSLASKWKKHESLFGQDDAEASHIEQSQTVVTMTVNSPFGSNEKTTVAREQLDISLTASALDASFVYSRKISAVKKVQDASINFQNLSTSPSGRLEPLVILDPKEFPKILLNDRTILEASNNKTPNPLNTNCAQKAITNSADSNHSITLNTNHPADENNLNSSNVVFDFRAKIGNISADTLFDISDGVLKDITM